ncbi:winged helix-turn-helix transcriptional regulator [Nocardioides albus]|uniref:DNA-binding HxlR family transcriptional regulator n=1 Tax=Nocardioides albus TaxID=1841 RepID=A0A7W5A1E4_9ACTN|nr:helix-turn-helix domain-containing protein [Nocardioides albus]MBB3087871.1 DNA-binding HxlR family transcriptional regulator [Nocardioides albus]
MRRKSFGTWPCSIARTVDLLGDAWTMLVLRELFYGETRFDGFATALGIPRSTLTNRLGLLVDEGLVDQREYQVDPVRHEYVLTDKGRDFFGVIAAINAWGDRWLSGEEGVPVVMRHESCGHDLDATVVCGSCDEPVRLDAVSVRPGPGYPARVASRPDVIERFERASRTG